MAQLVAHLHGMERVRGSNPLSSTDRVSGDFRKPFFHAKNGGIPTISSPTVAMLKVYRNSKNQQNVYLNVSHKNIGVWSK